MSFWGRKYKQPDLQSTNWTSSITIHDDNSTTASPPRRPSGFKVNVIKKYVQGDTVVASCTLSEEAFAYLFANYKFGDDYLLSATARGSEFMIKEHVLSDLLLRSQ